MAEGQSSTVSPTVEYSDIPGYPGYRVGDDGSVWSCRKQIGLGGGRGTRTVLGETWKLLRPTTHNRGRRTYVNLCINNKATKRFVSRLVLFSFVGPPPTPEHEAAHSNGNPTDNRLTNLRWATPKENEADKVVHGTKLLGERTNSAKLDPDKVRRIRAMKDQGLLPKRIGQVFGVSRMCVSNVISRRTWAHVD